MTWKPNGMGKQVDSLTNLSVEVLVSVGRSKSFNSRISFMLYIIPVVKLPLSMDSGAATREFSRMVVGAHTRWICGVEFEVVPRLVWIHFCRVSSVGRLKVWMFFMVVMKRMPAKLVLERMFFD